MNFDRKPGKSLSGVVEAILEVGRQRNSLLESMRLALESGDNETALTFARQLCGINHEKSHPVN
jgi:hypothetical protein